MLDLEETILRSHREPRTATRMQTRIDSGEDVLASGSASAWRCEALSAVEMGINVPG